LAGVVDYAGLYPPASLDMGRAVQNYAEYRMSDDAWMLGRFVVPIDRIPELEDSWKSLEENVRFGWRLSVVLGSNVEQDLACVHAFNASHEGYIQIDSVEGRLTTPGAIARATAAAKRRVELFVEVPTRDDPSSLTSAIQEWGVHAKIRTGGTTPDAIPSSAEVVQFLRRCRESQLAFKATAGLHHPVRSEFRLTYEDSAPRAVMYGYLNLLMAAAFMQAGWNDQDVRQVLEESDADAFGADPRSVRWNQRSLTLDQLRDARRFVLSFGSCSFREPIEELRSLRLRA
jgi:hypothetical protein